VGRNRLPCSLVAVKRVATVLLVAAGVAAATAIDLARAGVTVAIIVAVWRWL
jgi:hypothetical protein